MILNIPCYSHISRKIRCQRITSAHCRRCNLLGYILPRRMFFTHLFNIRLKCHCNRLIETLDLRNSFITKSYNAVQPKSLHSRIHYSISVFIICHIFGLSKRFCNTKLILKMKIGCPDNSRIIEVFKISNAHIILKLLCQLLILSFALMPKFSQISSRPIAINILTVIILHTGLNCFHS